jgi:carbonic anhydrase
LCRADPGDIFVLRNIANQAHPEEPGCASVLQFGVDVLKVRHIIVCGHYGCGGVRATMRRDRMGLVDNWLRHVADVRDKHSALIDRVDDEDVRVGRLCELNVVEQVSNVCMTTVVGDAWARGQTLSVHGIIYGLKDGLLSDLSVSAGSVAESSDGYRDAIARISRG